MQEEEKNYSSNTEAVAAVCTYAVVELVPLARGPVSDVGVVVPRSGLALVTQHTHQLILALRRMGDQRVVSCPQQDGVGEEGGGEGQANHSKAMVGARHMWSNGGGEGD